MKPTCDLSTVVHDIADAIVAIDGCGARFKEFQCGAGPFGEPQLVREIASRLLRLPKYVDRVTTHRCPDLRIREIWDLEFKIARPFGHNGKQAENWSVNLLHPYPGNVSCIGDCIKLLGLASLARKAVVVVVGYEHDPPQIDLAPLLRGFEVIASEVAEITLSPRVEVCRGSLIHPVHQRVRVCAWEVLGNSGFGSSKAPCQQL